MEREQERELAGVDVGTLRETIEAVLADQKVPDALALLRVSRARDLLREADRELALAQRHLARAAVPPEGVNGNGYGNI